MPPVSSSQLLLRRLIFLTLPVQFVVGKGSVAVLSRVSFLNCSLKTEIHPGNWICIVTGACCKSSVVRHRDSRGPVCCTAVPLLSLSFCSLDNGAVLMLFFFVCLFFLGIFTALSSMNRYIFFKIWRGRAGGGAE